MTFVCLIVVLNLGLSFLFFKLGKREKLMISPVKNLKPSISFEAVNFSFIDFIIVFQILSQTLKLGLKVKDSV